MRRRRLAASATLALLVSVLGGLLAAPPAQASYRVDCNPEGDSRVVVILAHGFADGPDVWTDDAIDRLTASGRDACVVRFDYSGASTRWVVDSQIGPRLAEAVDTWAAVSWRGGGAGRVVIVAHSMGGLAARCALDPTCGGRDVGTDVATVVTLSTPSLGSGLRGTVLTPAFDLVLSVVDDECAARRDLDPAVAPIDSMGVCGLIETYGTSDASRAFTPGSAELAALDGLRSETPTYAMAGRAELVTSYFGRLKLSLGSLGDLVVGVESALHGAATVDGLGGTETVDCGELNLAFVPGVTAVGVVPWPDLSCTHLSEPSDPRFLDAARRQIAASVTSPVNPEDLLTYLPDGDPLGVEFDSPSRNIHCSIWHSPGSPAPGAWRFGCSIGLYEFVDPPDVDGCDVTYGGGFVVSHGGDLSPLCRGGEIFGGESQDVGILPYGSSVTYEGVTCRSGEVGVTCLDGAGTGFRLSRSSYTLLGWSRRPPPSTRHLR